jgi:hypothetical protein
MGNKLKNDVSDNRRRKGQVDNKNCNDSANIG